MTSEELNQRVKQVCDEVDVFEAFGGKCIPYIGWYWRDVDFDAETYRFGVIPDGDGSLIGFMENNKWGYSRVEADETEWAEIKQLLVEAVTDSTVEKLGTVNSAIQTLGRKVNRVWI